MMKHRERGGRSRQFTTTENLYGRDCEDRGHGRRHRGMGGHRGMRGHEHRGRRGGRSGRLFDYGELRLLVLAMIADEPRHGYELIKAIEDRFGGSYTPSPGVIYPTLSWLNDMGYADVTPEAGGRKRYAISDGGKAFLAANQADVDALLARSAEGETEGRGHGRGRVPAPVVRSMENLKMALRLRLREGELTDEVLHRVAAAIDTAAQEVERA